MARQEEIVEILISIGQWTLDLVGLLLVLGLLGLSPRPAPAAAPLPPRAAAAPCAEDCITTVVLAALP